MRRNGTIFRENKENKENKENFGMRKFTIYRSFVSSVSDSEKSGMGVCGCYALSENIRATSAPGTYLHMYAGGK